MTEAVFDTSILIDHLRDVPSATNLLKKVQEGEITGYISTLTETELFSGKDGNDPVKRDMLARLIGRFGRIEVSSNIARKAGDIRRAYGTLVGDAVIAATAESMNCRLFTKNIKDFRKIKEIEAEEPY